MGIITLNVRSHQLLFYRENIVNELAKLIMSITFAHDVLVDGVDGGSEAELVFFNCFTLVAF